MYIVKTSEGGGTGKIIPSSQQFNHLKKTWVYFCVIGLSEIGSRYMVIQSIFPLAKPWRMARSCFDYLKKNKYFIIKKNCDWGKYIVVYGYFYHLYGYFDIQVGKIINSIWLPWWHYFVSWKRRNTHFWASPLNLTI